MLDEFATCFNKADIVIVTDIYAAREKNDGSITPQMLIERLKANNVNAMYIGDFEEIAKYIHENAKGSDIVLTIGAGTITNLSNLL